MKGSVFSYNIIYSVTLVFLLALTSLSASATVTVTQNSPVNYFNTSRNYVLFNATAVTNETLKNCSLWTDIIGIFTETAINTTVISNQAFTFNITGIADSIYNYATNWYKWRVLCYDNSSYSNSSDRYFSVNAVDETKPNITSIISPIGTVESTNNTRFNVTVVDDFGLSTCSLYTDRLGTFQLEAGSNISFNNAISGSYQYTINSMPDGNYTWNVYCVDTSSNTGYLANNQVFKLDVINDAPVFTTGTAWSALNNMVNTFDVNATDSNDGDTILYSLNETGKLTINSLTGVISYTPTQIESFNAVVTACDNHNACTNQTISISSRTVVNTMTVSSAAVSGSRNSSATASFVITNTGDETLTNINISTDASGTYHTVFTPNMISSIGPGSSATVNINIDIPASASSTSTNIGTIFVKSSKVNATATLSMSAPSMLEFDLIRITGTNIDSDDYDDLDGSSNVTISTIMPGDLVTISVDVENLFDADNDATDIIIEDVTLTLKIKKLGNDGDDIEYEFPSFDLSAESIKKNLKYNFTVPYFVKDKGEYGITLTVEGKDKNKAKHKTEWKSVFVGERRTHLIKLVSFAPQKTTVTRCDASNSASVDIINLGIDVEKNIVVKLWNSALGINKIIAYEEMSEEYDDDDNRHTATFDITMPKDAKLGLYTFNIETYYKTDRLSESGSFAVKLEDCSAADAVQAVTTSVSGTATSSSTQSTTSSAAAPYYSSSGESAVQILSSAGKSSGFVTSAIKREGIFGANTISELPPYGLALVIGNIVVGVSILALIIKALFFRPRVPGFDI